MSVSSTSPAVQDHPVVDATKDDDGSLVARITYRTGERFISRSFKAPDKAWTVRLLSEDQARELGRVDGLPMDKGLHRQIIEFLIRREYGRRRVDT